MVASVFRRQYGPIGIDVGSRSVKLVQLSTDARRLIEAVRWEFTGEAATNPAERAAQVTEALLKAREGRRFRGRDATLSLSWPDLFVQNLRVPKVAPPELERLVHQEAASRLPFSIAESELRFLEAADVRQGDQTKREVILLACHRPRLDGLLSAVVAAGLRPVAVDVEPTAILRCYVQQYRRDEDREQRVMFVHVGAGCTAVVIARGPEILFVKYIDVGGRVMDDAVARHLELGLPEAIALRRHNGDRRADQQDPEVTRSVSESVRPVIDRLANELAMCVRYYSVAFRGQPLSRLVLGGGEATPAILEALAPRLDVKCELGDPLRAYGSQLPPARRGQWDVAAGLALREPKVI